MYENYYSLTLGDGTIIKGYAKDNGYEDLLTDEDIAFMNRQYRKIKKQKAKNK